MDAEFDLLKRLYERFNLRDIDGVLSELAVDVAWANGMEGGYVHGHEAVRDYWTRQWAIINPHVAPVNFQRNAEHVIVEVQQSIRDLEGNLLDDPAQGLQNKTAEHIFHLYNGKITRFDIEA